jgi:hypothetical protein
VSSNIRQVPDDICRVSSNIRQVPDDIRQVSCAIC